MSVCSFSLVYQQLGEETRVNFELLGSTGRQALNTSKRHPGVWVRGEERDEMREKDVPLFCYAYLGYLSKSLFDTVVVQRRVRDQMDPEY